MIVRIAFLISVLLAANVSAQSPVTFTGKSAQNGAVVSLDSVYVVSESGTKDTTLIGGTSLAMDWLTAIPHPATLQPGLVLGSVYPNSFETQTTFEVGISRRGILRLEVINLLGLRAAKFERIFEPGAQRFILDAAGLPAGVYFLCAGDGNQVSVQKLLKQGSSTNAPAALRWAGPGDFIPDRKTGKAAALTASYTFIGYAHDFLPDTISNVDPAPGQHFEFVFISEPDTRKIRSGRIVDEGATVLPAGGGIVSVNREGSPLKGFSIAVPSGSYAENRTFTIGHAAIEGHDLGPNFNPISPLITIGNGGGYSDSVMEIRIPVEIPAGHFAMAWLYNERTGEIEGLPPVAQDAHSITVLTRHFSTSTISGFGKAANGRTTYASGSPFANVVVTSILESALTNQTIINTGFAVKQDDWEFVNYGSTIAPDGHCAGQSITSMWYYYEQRLSASPPKPPLYHAYDRLNTSKEVLWMDNPFGYRFASVVQQDLDFNGRLAKLLRKGRDSTYHSLGWKAFAAAMFITGCPQYVGLTRLKANGDPDGGHAIIGYKMSMNEGKLYVADPNYPGDDRFISYNSQTGYFSPYSTKQNAAEVDAKAYANIGYTAKTALIDWDKISPRWEEFLDESIGTKGSNTFPAYEVKYDEHPDAVDRKEKIKTESDSIWFKPTGDIGISCFKPDGSRAENQPASWKIPLKKGTNTIGIYTTKGGDFVDFFWIDVEQESYASGYLSLSGLTGSYKRNYKDTQGQPVSESFEQSVPLYRWNFQNFEWQSKQNGVYTFTGNDANGGITVTISFTVTLDMQDTSITNFDYSYHYVQGQDWEESESISGAMLPYDRDHSWDDYDLFQVKGTDVASHLIGLAHTFNRLDRDFTETLSSFTAGAGSTLNIRMNK